MKALIVGAGRMGYAAGLELLRRGFEVEVDYLDVNPKAIVPNGSVLYRLEDTKHILATQDWITSAAKKWDVIIGAAGYQLNEELTRAAIATKTHFCDLGGNNDVVKKQLAMSAEAEKAGIVVIPDCGLAPGLACMLAARGIEILGGTADEVNIYVGGLPQDETGPLKYALSWSVDGLINEYMEKAQIIEYGKLTEVDSLTGLEEDVHIEGSYEYLEAFYTSGGISTLVDTYLGKVQNLTYKTLRYHGHCEGVLQMKNLGMFDKDIVHGKTRREFTEALLNQILPKISKDNPDEVFVKVHIKNYNDHGEVEFSFHHEYDHEKDLSAMAVTTGFSIANVAYLLGTGKVKDHIYNKTRKLGGVIPGELALPLVEYIKLMEESGVKIHCGVMEDQHRAKLLTKSKYRKTLQEKRWANRVDNFITKWWRR